MRYLRQSTSVDVVIGPVWSTTDGALKSDLAYNASGINCDIYKNGTKADISLQGTAGNGYLRPGSGEAQYILTLSTTDTNTIGSARITLSATGFYMRPEEFVVLHANVYDVLFGSVALATVGSAMTLAANQDVRNVSGTITDKTGYSLAADQAVNVTKIGGAALNTAAAQLGVNVVNWKGATAPAMTGDAFARLGAPTGASVSADVAAVKSDSGAIKTKTDYLPSASPGAVGGLLKVGENGPIEFKSTADYTPAVSIVTEGEGASGINVVATGSSAASLIGNNIGMMCVGGAGPGLALNSSYGNAVSMDSGSQTVFHPNILAHFAEAVRDVDNASPAAGSLGAKVNSAASAGDPWSTTLPGSYSAGSAGKLVGDMAGTVSTNLDGKISSRSTFDPATANVKVGNYDTGKSPSEQVLKTPANKLATDGDGKVTPDTVTAAAPTAANVAGAVRTELATELAHIDADISSRSTFDAASNKVTVATNEDKTGYSLTGAYDRAKNAASNTEVTNATSGLSTLDGTDVEQALADYGTAKSSELPGAGPTAAQVADKLLGRNLAGGSDGGRTVRQALRPLRNRMEISEEGVMSVYKEDDATVDWEAAVTTDAAAEPITKVDPV